MKPRNVAFAAFLILLTTSLRADVVIKKYSTAPPVREHAATSTHSAETPQPISASFAAEKTENPTTFYILPFFKIDSNDPNGETTFVSVRNESNAVQTVEISFFAADSASSPEIRQNALLPKETWVLNLRTIISLTPDVDGFIRGWARITGTGRLSADFFQFNPSQDFATGAAPIDIDGSEFCETVKSRFLVGGTFDGGTLITFMMDQPLGGDFMNDPPSITGTVYLEDSTMAGTFEIYTDRFTVEVNAADLLEDGVNFGSMDIVFENNFSGGFAFTEYKANNRFSVGLKSVCLDI